MTYVIPIQMEYIAKPTDGGANLIAPIAKPIVVLGYCLTVAIGAPLGGTGFAQSLVYGTFTSGSPQFGTNGDLSVDAPFARSPDVTTATSNGTVPVQAGSTIASYSLGDLFRTIVKADFPNSAITTLTMSGLQLAVPAGAVFNLHVESTSYVDTEIQGVIYYNPAN